MIKKGLALLIIPAFLVGAFFPTDLEANSRKTIVVRAYKSVHGYYFLRNVSRHTTPTHRISFYYVKGTPLPDWVNVDKELDRFALDVAIEPRSPKDGMIDLTVIVNSKLNISRQKIKSISVKELGTLETIPKRMKYRAQRRLTIRDIGYNIVKMF